MAYATKPLVSVAMATYNGEKYLAEQLESILSQDYPNVELVVFDDHSRDRTVEILERYRSRHHFRVFRNPRTIGWKRNFMQAMMMCRGALIAFADQDDVWFPRKIRRLVEEIGTSSLIHSDAAVIGEDGSPVAQSDKDYFQVDRRDLADSSQYGIVNGLVRGCEMMCTRQVVERAFVIARRTYLPSHDLWIPFVASSLSGCRFLDEPLMNWRLHASSAIAQQRKLPRALHELGVAAGSWFVRAQRRRAFTHLLRAH